MQPVKPTMESRDHKTDGRFRPYTFAGLDLIGRIFDMLPMRSGRASEVDSSKKTGSAIVISVIEPNVGQLVGALMLWLSLRRSPTPSTFRLCIVLRESDITELIETCSALGLEFGVARPQHDNPFLNKWLAFDSFTGLREKPHVLLLDWDTLLCAPCALPGPFGSTITARRNPSGMYRDIIAQARKPLPRTPAIFWGRVRTSINGGVLIGPGDSLARCAEKTIAWVAEITRRAPVAPAWKVEQLALSIAVSEIGLSELNNRWNVTPQLESRVSDRDVCLWHYNDGVEGSYALKRCLDQPGLVKQHLEQFSTRWPRSVAAFSELYEEVLGMSPVVRLISRRSQSV